MVRTTNVRKLGSIGLGDLTRAGAESHQTMEARR